MKRRHLVSFTAAIIMVLVLSCSAWAFLNSNIGIRINGQSKYFQPSAEILNNRTMVPIRFIIEDDSIKGQVSWNNELKKVFINCGEKEMEFTIGSRKVKVDDETYYLDAAPYIHNNRTFVPLRFIAEQLGAVVGWNSWNRVVTIDFNQPAGRVFAYYYRNFSELKENADLFSDVAFRWFQTDGSGNLFYEYQDKYDEILAFAKSNGIKCHAGVVLMDKTALHELLSNPQNRANLVSNLVKQVNKDGYNGVNIDFEFIPSDDKGLFNTFLSELKAGLGPDKTLSAAVFARTSNDKWAVGYDYQKIGEIADLVVVMAYDYSYKTSDPGPVAPLWWVKDVVSYMTGIIPSEKILLGVPTYGYDWASELTTATITLNKLNTIRQNYQVTEHFNAEAVSPYYTYTDGNGFYHQIWLENKTSLEAKLKVATDNHLAGISFWRIGNGFTDLYNLLEKRQN